MGVPRHPPDGLGIHRQQPLSQRWTPTCHKWLVRSRAPSIPCSEDRDLRATVFGCNPVVPLLAVSRPTPSYPHFRFPRRNGRSGENSTAENRTAALAWWAVAMSDRLQKARPSVQGRFRPTPFYLAARTRMTKRQNDEKLPELVQYYSGRSLEAQYAIRLQRPR